MSIVQRAKRQTKRRGVFAICVITRRYKSGGWLRLSMQIFTKKQRRQAVGKDTEGA